MSKVKRFYAPGLDCLYRSDVDAPRQLIALVLGSDYDALVAKLAMAEDAAAKGDAARQQCGGMEMEIEELRAELAELRARVVVPDRRDPLNSTGDDENPRYAGFNACLDELARLNGLTVSEGLLRRTLEFVKVTNCKGSIPLGLIEELSELLGEVNDVSRTK
ncbi:hypothetical protein FBPa45_0102 [Pseudomonas phage vB_PaeS_FBPa45]|nr:hypothetical protein FBPa45_0102 [Pseudomonas phage vB_PaeS_FBPa45]